MPAINKIILGTVQFGLNYGINNTHGLPELNEVFNILSKAHFSGVRTLDTAEAYGISHSRIGKFHTLNSDIRFDVITKLPSHIDEPISQKIEKYLQQLNVTMLYGLLFHSFKSYRENQAEMAFLVKCKGEGVIKHIGVSVYTNDEIEEVINDNDIDIIQLPFNLFDNINLRGEILHKAKTRGKIIHTRSVFLQGLFFTALNSDKRIVKLLSKELQTIQDISNHYQYSVKDLALSYSLSQALIDNVIIGVDTIDQLSENLSVVKDNIPTSLIDDINEIHIQNADLLNPSLWNL